MSQPRLPGTLPTPAAARKALAAAGAKVRHTANILDTCKEALRALREEMAEAGEMRNAAEVAVSTAVEESAMLIDADRRHERAVLAVRDVEARVVSARAALREARAACKLAEKERRNAEDDLHAIRSGAK